MYYCWPPPCARDCSWGSQGLGSHLISIWGYHTCTVSSHVEVWKAGGVQCRCRISRRCVACPRRCALLSGMSDPDKGRAVPGQLDISYDAFIRTTDPKHEVRTPIACDRVPATRPSPLHGLLVLTGMALVNALRQYRHSILPVCSYVGRDHGLCIRKDVGRILSAPPRVAPCEGLRVSELPHWRLSARACAGGGARHAGARLGARRHLQGRLRRCNLSIPACLGVCL